MAFLSALAVFILMLLPTAGCILIGFALHAPANHVQLWILLANAVYIIALLILLPALRGHSSSRKDGKDQPRDPK